MMSGVAQAWQRFWFKPEPTSTLAFVRIAFGLVMVAWSVSLLPGFFVLFGADGIVPRQPDPAGRGTWGLLGLLPGDATLIVVLVVMLVASLCLVVGYRARAAALLVFVGLLSFQRRNPFVFDSGDGLLRIIALFLALSPASASLSLDRFRTAPRDRLWEFPARSPWALRLMQVQLSVIYLSTVWAKARGTTWNDGTAVSYALRVRDVTRFPLPRGVTDSVLVANVATYGTLAVEFALGVLVWNRKLRPWVLGFGVALHLAIDYSIRVGFFTLAMFVLYIAFIPSGAAVRTALTIRDRLRGAWARVPARPAAGHPERVAL